MQLRPLILIALAGFGFSVVFSANVQARQVTTTMTGSQGNQATVQSTVNRSGNTRTFNRTTTLPGNQTTSSSGSFTGSGSGSYSGSVDRTNRQGETNSYQVTGQRSYANGTRQNTATVTGPNGQQGTVNSSGSCQNGQCNGNRTVTYPNGQTRQVNTTSNRTAPGSWVGRSTVTRRNGNTVTGTFQRTYKR